MLVGGQEPVEGVEQHPEGDGTRDVLVVAAFASLGAGAIHAVAAGTHSEPRQAMWTFIVVAIAQIGWGALALVRPGRAVAGVGAVLGIGAAVGWMAAKTTGIGFIDGFAGSEAVQWADGLAVALALVSAVACVIAVLGLRTPRIVAPLALAAVLVATVPAMALTGGHSHAGGHGHDEAAGHDEADPADHADEHAAGSGAVEGHGDAHEAAVVPPTPYDPAMPIDLSGVEGVTPQQQAAAENLIAITILRLPQFADPAVANAAGFHSIGDGATGYEHYINRSFVNDDVFLNPDQPESLVYQVVNGQKTLVAAMFMLPNGYTLDDVPELGGRLTQWHIHDNLCYTPDPVAPRVAGLREPGGPCREGLVPGGENPMIHVWIVPHECGPFAALDGIAGGTIAAGEDRWCDHAHGA